MKELNNKATKLKKLVAMASFYCLASKIWKNNMLFCREEGKNVEIVFLKRKKPTLKKLTTFIGKYIIKYS